MLCQQYGQVTVSRWISKAGFRSRLQTLCAPGAGAIGVRVGALEIAPVAQPFVKAMSSFGPKLDGFEPEPVTAPVRGPRQRMRGRAVALDTELACRFLRRALELRRLRERTALCAAPRVELAQRRPGREVCVALGGRRAHNGTF